MPGTHTPHGPNTDDDDEDRVRCTMQGPNIGETRLRATWATTTMEAMSGTLYKGRDDAGGKQTNDMGGTEDDGLDGMHPIHAAPSM